MWVSRNLLFVLISLQGLVGWSQVIVSKVSFAGLGKTKPQYVKQYLLVQEGQQLDSIQLESDRQRLANLEVFSNASYHVIKDEGRVQVVFTCQEVQTLLPIFNFGGVEGNFWFLAGLTEANLNGRGGKFTGFYQYYDRSSVSAYLVFDRIKNSRWGVLFNFVKWGTVEPLFFNAGTAIYDYDNNTFGLGGIYHLNFNSSFELSTAYFTEEYNRVDNEFIEGAPLRAKTRKQLIKLIYKVNHLDYHFFYIDGFSSTLNAETVLSYNGDPDFNIIFNDFRLFKRFTAQGNFGSRLRLGIATNENSPFAPFVLDSYVNIRGVGNRVDRGTAMIINNTEYRQTIRDRGNVAVQVVAFSDFGTWRTPGGGFDDLTDAQNFEWFAGAGFRVIHKKIFNAILRVDYGVDLQTPNQNGFVIGVGQYF